MPDDRQAWLIIVAMEDRWTSSYHREYRGRAGKDPFEALVDIDPMSNTAHLGRNHASADSNTERAGRVGGFRTAESAGRRRTGLPSSECRGSLEGGEGCSRNGPRAACGGGGSFVWVSLLVQLIRLTRNLAKC